VESGRVWSHRGAREGQVLILTKPIGNGIIGQAIRAGSATEAMIQGATAQMLSLNDRAAEIGLDEGATSATDITGFGLLGHLRNLVEAAGLDAELYASSVPLLEGVQDLAAAGTVPGGSKRNLAYASHITSFAASVTETTRLILADAQTSGGLLLCVPEERANDALRRLVDAGRDFSRIVGVLGRKSEAPRIRVVG
jgi:selenide,water dikinase